MLNTDLHTHSYYSDGQISPKELVKLAKKRGVKNLSLTDHDSVKGVQEAVREGKKVGVNVIPGVEIRTNYSEVLGYFVDIKNKKLISELKKNTQEEIKKVKDVCKKLVGAGYNISYEELKKRFPKSRNNFNSFYPIYTLYLKKYVKTTFEGSKLIGKLKPIKIKKISAIKAIKLIKGAGGVPVLAHPWLAEDKKLTKVKYLAKAGLEGIEINNGDNLKFMMEASGNKTIIKDIKEVAKKYNLIITSGSDYHGPKIIKIMPGNHNLGRNNCDENVVEQLRRLSVNG
jgi:hypothetical protein